MDLKYNKSYKLLLYFTEEKNEKRIKVIPKRPVITSGIWNFTAKSIIIANVPIA